MNVRVGTLDVGSVDNTTLGYDTVVNQSLAVNTTANGTLDEIEELRSPYALWQAILLIVILSFIIIGTILGNVLVCTAVGIVKKLQTPSNLLIVSLAVSDLFVALLDMPFAATYELLGSWPLGETMCDAWTSLDVMLCTASILNLCAISIDRYMVITQPFTYAMKRTPLRMAGFAALVWMTSALISIPPLFGWKAKFRPNHCSVSQDIGYQFYATIGAFYLPLGVMIFIYGKIFLVSARIANAEAKSGMGERPPSISGPSGQNFVNHNMPNGELRRGDETLAQMLPNSDQKKRKKFRPLKLFHKKSGLNRISSSKERKATKTLGVIMGAFTACWLPFFILALIKPFCNNPDTCIPHWLNSTFLWLGYANSFLNPIIYARFNRDFRRPFKEILLCRCRDINHRLRMDSYQEQYGGTPGPATMRDAIRPPVDTVVRYHSQGQTIVKLGNGDTTDSKPAPENKIIQNPTEEKV